MRLRCGFDVCLSVLVWLERIYIIVYKIIYRICIDMMGVHLL